MSVRVFKLRWAKLFLFTLFSFRNVIKLWKLYETFSKSSWQQFWLIVFARPLLRTPGKAASIPWVPPPRFTWGSNPFWWARGVLRIWWANKLYLKSLSQWVAFSPVGVAASVSTLNHSTYHGSGSNWITVWCSAGPLSHHHHLQWVWILGSGVWILRSGFWTTHGALRITFERALNSVLFCWG